MFFSDSRVEGWIIDLSYRWRLLFKNKLLWMGKDTHSAERNYGISSPVPDSTANYPLGSVSFWIIRSWTALGSSAWWCCLDSLVWLEKLIPRVEGSGFQDSSYAGRLQGEAGWMPESADRCPWGRLLTCFQYCRTVLCWPLHFVVKLLLLFYVVCGTHLISSCL